MKLYNYFHTSIHKDKTGVCQKDRRQLTKLLFEPEGVSHADEEVIFEYRLGKAEELWRDLVTDPKQIPYFQKELVPKLKTNFETKQKIPWVADLGNWTNNNCESINSVLKQLVEWKSQSLPTLVSLLKKVCTLFLAGSKGPALYIGYVTHSLTH